MHELTGRQREVLRLADWGMDDAGDRRGLHVGVSTVLGHWHAIYETLHVEKGEHRRERTIYAWGGGGAA